MMKPFQGVWPNVTAYKPNVKEIEVSFILPGFDYPKTDSKSGLGEGYGRNPVIIYLRRCVNGPHQSAAQYTKPWIR